MVFSIFTVAVAVVVVIIIIIDVAITLVAVAAVVITIVAAAITAGIDQRFPCCTHKSIYKFTSSTVIINAVLAMLEINVNAVANVVIFMEFIHYLIISFEYSCAKCILYEILELGVLYMMI